MKKGSTLFKIFIYLFIFNAFGHDRSGDVVHFETVSGLAVKVQGRVHLLITKLMAPSSNKKVL